MPEPLFLGLDIGTSGARAMVIDAAGQVRGQGRAAMGATLRSPEVWWRAADTALRAALSAVDPRQVVALAVDGTSGTVLPVDGQGAPLADGLMYNDVCDDAAILGRIADAAPKDSAARGASSALARAHLLTGHGPTKILHQADWIAGRLSGRWVSDDNNALKTGYDVERSTWPDWIARSGFDMALLPTVEAPGTAIGPIRPETAQDFGLSRDAMIVAGTTDGCASFVATGAAAPGEAVTALGTTLTLKLLSDHPISAPEFGIYSHRIMGHWLVGGASNSGGAVLLAHFSAEQIASLSAQIAPGASCALDYYPLVRPGERFPIADPDLAPRLEPRPASDVDFLHAMLTGMARIEALGYQRLRDLGAPALVSVRSVGGGAQNDAWSRIRKDLLGVPLAVPASTEAAYGTALLARRGVA